MNGLPEGFELDPPQQAQPAGAATGLPEGFTLDAPGSNLPDVGEPLINLGTQERPPLLMPQVNEYINKKLAPSVNRNLIEPITHPIDTLGGIGSVAAGLGQYALQGELGTGFEPSVDALMEDYKKTYGSLEGFKNAVINDPARVAMDASGALGALRGIGRRAGVIARPPTPVAAPTLEELHDASQAGYRNMHGYGVQLHPQVMENVAAHIEQDLLNDGYRDYLAPKTWRAFEELRDPQGYLTNTQDIEGVRRALNRVTADPAERDAAHKAIAHIDNAMANIQPSQVAVNPQFAPLIAQQAREARGNWAAYKQAQQLETARTNAELQAASTGSGANIDNATRQKFRAILTNPKKARGYNAAELDAMRQLVRGTTPANTARLIGKLAPSGVVSGALSATLGHAVGHTLGVPIIGYAAKQFADAATARAAARLSEQRRLRSPLARQTGAVAAPTASFPVQGAFQLGRLGNTPNPYAPQQP